MKRNKIPDCSTFEGVICALTFSDKDGIHVHIELNADQAQSIVDGLPRVITELRNAEAEEKSNADVGTTADSTAANNLNATSKDGVEGLMAALKKAGVEVHIIKL